jgi:hypothetical protein
MKLLLAPLLIVGSMLVVAGCSAIGESSNGEEQPGGAAGENEAALNGRDAASCRYPRRYIAVVSTGTCAEITGERGKWTPSPLFPDAPPEASNACVYSWSGERYAPVDRAALYTTIKPYTTGQALTPSCSANNQTIDLGLVEEIPTLDIFGYAGSVGCDVCGTLVERKIWVVLPPEETISRQFEVRLSNGTPQYFQIRAEEGTRALTIQLPDPPAGTEYVQGRVAVY